MTNIDIDQSYSREQAIADGLLIDVTNLVLKYEGEAFPVAISRAIWTGNVIEENLDPWRDVVIIGSKYRFRPEGLYSAGWGVTDPNEIPIKPMLSVKVKVDLDGDYKKRVTVFSAWEDPDFRCPRVPGTSFHTV